MQSLNFGQVRYDDYETSDAGVPAPASPPSVPCGICGVAADRTHCGVCQRAGCTECVMLLRRCCTGD